MSIARAVFDDASVISPDEIVEWAERKSPTLVVHDPDGAVAGYARAKPNEALGMSRSAGQTAVLAHIAVLDGYRGAGVGRTLHNRIIQTLAMLGFSRVFAQIPAHLATWYAELGWTVHPAGVVAAWIEPPNSQDNRLMPGVTPRTFAPILCMQYLSAYPVLVERWIGDARPLANWTLNGRVPHALLPQRVGAALAEVLREKPELARRLPQALCDVAIDEDDAGPLARILVELGR